MLEATCFAVVSISLAVMIYGWHRESRTINRRLVAKIRELEDRSHLFANSTADEAKRFRCTADRFIQDRIDWQKQRETMQNEENQLRNELAAYKSMVGRLDDELSEANQSAAHWKERYDMAHRDSVMLSARLATGVGPSEEFMVAMRNGE